MTQNVKTEKISPRVISTKNTRGKTVSCTPPAMGSVEPRCRLNPSKSTSRLLTSNDVRFGSSNGLSLKSYMAPTTASFSRLKGQKENKHLLMTLRYQLAKKCHSCVISSLKNQFLNFGPLILNRLVIVKCPLSTEKELSKKGRVSYDYRSDNDGVTVIRWYDSKDVSLASSFLDVGLFSSLWERGWSNTMGMSRINGL
ncbi:unnamed protein product [Lepeophtheirus salmonis]|uniref:(salmon louse) hypothetical protein n=1 Tax=Lepeophtheirus salmonis TaxID=72036 RepID=A0A7R8CV21_LEPSM|nr:unnamed protein product [Lepeophtheirus salmonis]CAF2941371.1 unnamed protein product [Lepeophtheirus salmonis]